MSLFKSKEWWSTTCGDGEQFDIGCLCVANIDNSPGGLDKIVVGSFSGLLRVFAPHATLQEDGTYGSPRADSLLLEAQFPAPVLQVQSGKFVFSSDKIHLAVLHPRKFSIFSISEISASVEYGSQHKLGLMYEHNLQRSAFRFTTGPFGKVKGRDFICVLSVDGTLSFFEQESFTFSRFLPGGLLPGPLAYLPKTDTFVTVSSSYQLEAYKYQVLAVAVAASSSSSESQDRQNVQSGKRVLMDWSYNLGEGALDISLIIPKTSATLIYVLGERHLFCITDSGSLKFLKKLEFHPSSFHVYAHGNDDSVFAMITSDTGMMFVLQDVTLRWAMQLPYVPIQISRINLRGLQGGVTTLSEDGKLNCCYLGTSPTIYTPPAMESREINYADTDRELYELYKVINAAQKTGMPLTGQTEAVLSISVTISDDLSILTLSENDAKLQTSSPAVTLKICLKVELPLESVQLMCHFDECFMISEPAHHFHDLSEETIVNIDIRLCENFVPSKLSGVIVAVCSSALGPPSVIQTPVKLPLKLCVLPCVPQKDAEFKITINTNKMSCKLSDIFSEFLLSEKLVTSSQAMGFQFYGGPIVTVLVAKSSSRYRLQSDCFGAMSILVQELLLRLKKLGSKSDGSEPIAFKYSAALPFQEFYCVVNKHLQNRQKSYAYEKRLGQLAAQFRVIEKRLLAKFKDKTTAPINNMDTLLESTYRQILSTSEALESHQHILKTSHCNLNASAYLLTDLMKMCSTLSDSNFELLQKIMCPFIADETEQGWEELVTSGLHHFLKSLFSYSNHEYILQDHQLNMPDDIELLKKQLAAVDDISNKSSIAEESEQVPSELIEEEKKDDDKEGEDNIPLGSKFGERRTSAQRKLSSLPPIQNVQDAANKSDARPLQEITNSQLDDDPLKDVLNTLPQIHTIPSDTANDVDEF